MSDNIPFEIQVEIVKRLPVKPLIQFRSVSKGWKSLIDSSRFIKHYSGQHLLVSYYKSLDYKQKYVSIVDDHTFPLDKVPVTVPPLVKMLNDPYILGSSHGLLCLYARHLQGISDAPTAVLWNLSVRKTVAVRVPNVADGKIYDTLLGFGVCHETIDPKIVKLTYISRWVNVESISDSIPWQVEVFTLSTGAWRPPYTTNLPRKSVTFYLKEVFVDGFLYWLAVDRITMGGEFRSHNVIISFDTTGEEFGEVSLPDNLANKEINKLAISKIRESLVVLDRNKDVVWMMESGVSKSFTKLFTIDANTPRAYVIGFRKSGEPIIENFEHGHWTHRLIAYDPYSKHMDDVGIDGIKFMYCVYPYTETLLLLDQSNVLIFDETGTLQLLSSFVF